MSLGANRSVPMMEYTAPPLICCFCNGEMPVGPRAEEAEESARIAFLDLLPGDGAAAFRAREQSFYCHLGCFRERLHDPAALLPNRYDDEEEEANREKVLDALGELTADLITFGENGPFRERLFASPAERWIEVAELCAGLPDAQIRLSELSERAGTEIKLLVQHLPDPLDPADEYSLIVFCEPSHPWSTAIVHLRGY